MLSHLKIVCLLLLCVVWYSCDSQPKVQSKPSTQGNQFSQYSSSVRDSFYIQTQLPLEYTDSLTKRYPVVIVLDGNFHFPMLAASVRQYELGGLLPPIILVGIGYKNFKEMDSLRVRDYLFPAALPSDEMKAAGGGEKFRRFIVNEFLPKIDAGFRTKTTNRSLLGHSFGGYFTLFSLLKQTSDNTHTFKNFVAASPSLWYNSFYLNHLPVSLKNLAKNDSVQVFLSVGSLENAIWDIKPTEKMTVELEKVTNLNAKGITYNSLGHMDTGQLSFLKGLQAYYR